ncbi:MAG TPA: cytochrome c peroxidase [Gammaproteobacteria bacterium]|nr:cytochrome c peroxidase [Gammaproteobacteria bacterium]
MQPARRLLFAVLSWALLSCSASPGSGPSFPPPAAQTLSAAATLGERIFHDESLSASGRMSCATCHSPEHAFAAPPGEGPVPIGGPALTTPGFRNAPSLKYLAANPGFFFDDEGTPTGGFDRDGRANSLAEQARRPFLAPHEMANASVADVVAKVAVAAYADDFRAVFGGDIFASPDEAFARVVLALQRYQLEDAAEFAPYSSRYDKFLAGTAQLSAQELRGLALFNDPARGNCAGCHPSARGAAGAPPLFTDFTYDNLGVPRNTAIPANADPDYYDLGLCGPDRTDLAAARPDLCGAFKVPTLRNIRLTAPYFHNGRFETLRDALHFYVQRDTRPELFYPLDAGGQPVKFDDLPAAYRANVNTTEVPYNRHAGDVPALSDGDIEDVIAFLNTLTDE